MSKYQVYPEYKDSGVEWLGEVPIDWSSKPLKFLCTCNDQTISDSTKSDYEIEYVDIGSVSSLQGITKTEKLEFSKAPSRARRLVQNGDVIISTVRTYLEAIFPIHNPSDNMVVSTGFAIIRPKSSLDKGFAAYCLRASGFIKEVVARSVGVSYPAINASDLINIPIPNCSLDQQTQIASFLDHETAKIDNLIEKQQQLIELIKEKRQAVISHAVTKGLNPNAPMKDSDVEWLGEVPKHWDSKPLKFLCTCNDEVISDSTKSDYELEYVDIGSVSSSQGIVKTEKMIFSKAPSRARRLVQDGDIIISTVRTYLEAIAPINNSPSNMVVSTGFAVIRPNLNLDKGFAAYCLRTRSFIGEVITRSVGVSYPAINASDLINISIPICPFGEQTQIASFLNQEIKKIDVLIEKANTAIQLLQERRTALISAAVTGKIDVRNWVAPATNDPVINTESQEATA